MRRRYNPRYYESAVPRYYDEYEKRFYPSHYQPHKPYGALNFLGDLLMLMLTGGLWFIWIFVREMRRRNVHSY